MTVPKYIRRYDCGHWFWFSKTHIPAIDSQMFCITCNKTVTVVASDAQEFSAKCKARNCKFLKYTGRSKELTFRAAVRHLRTHPNHTVDTYEPNGSLLHKFDGRNQVSIDDYEVSPSEKPSDFPWL